MLAHARACPQKENLVVEPPPPRSPRCGWLGAIRLPVTLSHTRETRQPFSPTDFGRDPPGGTPSRVAGDHVEVTDRRWISRPNRRRSVGSYRARPDVTRLLPRPSQCWPLPGERRAGHPAEGGRMHNCRRGRLRPRRFGRDDRGRGSRCGGSRFRPRPDHGDVPGPRSRTDG